jgi:hypothetical protein
MCVAVMMDSSVSQPFSIAERCWSVDRLIDSKPNPMFSPPQKKRKQVSTVEHQTLSDLESIFDVNIKGVLRLTQKWLPTLRQQQGRIIMVSSVAGFMVIPRASAYCASKHALEAFTDGLRVRFIFDVVWLLFCSVWVWVIVVDGYGELSE